MRQEAELQQKDPRVLIESIIFNIASCTVLQYVGTVHNSLVPLYNLESVLLHTYVKGAQYQAR